MAIFWWAISQLLSYSIGDWILFVGIAAAAAFALRMPGVILGHIVIAALIGTLDEQWIQSEMHKPGWDGQLDQDFVFILGVLARVVLINTVLLPLSIWMVRLRTGPRQGAV